MRAHKAHGAQKYAVKNECS